MIFFYFQLFHEDHFILFRPYHFFLIKREVDILRLWFHLKILNLGVSKYFKGFEIDSTIEYVILPLVI